MVRRLRHPVCGRRGVPPAADEGLGLLAGGTPQVGANAQLAAAESKRAAKNTANGLLGGILLLMGSMVWAVGMAVFGKKA